MTELVYLYAVAPADGAAWLRSHEVRGIGGARVRPLVEDGVAAAVSEVPTEDFEQEPLDRNVTDASWLAPRAASHQEVNARLLEGLGAVLPLAFGTIFRGEDRVQRVLRERGGELADALAAVRGRAEWVITLERDAATGAPDTPATRTLRDRATASEPGKAYLLTRKLDEVERTERRRLDAAAVASLRESLDDIAEDITEEPIVEGGPLARLTVLVPVEREAALRGAVVRSAEGYAARVSGPWPPYRFGARIGRLRD